MKEKIKGFKYRCDVCKKEVIHDSDLTLPEGWFETIAVADAATVNLKDWKGRPVMQVRGGEHFCSLDCHSGSISKQVDNYEELVSVKELT